MIAERLADRDEFRQRHKRRFKRTLEFLGGYDYKVILDLGCGIGYLGELLKKKYPESDIYLADREKPKNPIIDDASVHFVAIKDLDENRLPFPDDYFDLVTNLEVIEHLYNPDNLLAEIHRILKPGGILVLSTPNLASWVNRILLLFVYFPIAMSISIKSNLTGKSDFLPKPPLESWEEAEYCYHVRAYTFSALKVLLELLNFKIIGKKGIYGYKSLYSNWMLHIIYIIMERFFPSMAQILLIKAIAKK